MDLLNLTDTNSVFLYLQEPASASRGFDIATDHGEYMARTPSQNWLEQLANRNRFLETQNAEMKDKRIQQLETRNCSLEAQHRELNDRLVNANARVEVLMNQRDEDEARIRRLANQFDDAHTHIADQEDYMEALASRITGLESQLNLPTYTTISDSRPRIRRHVQRAFDGVATRCKNAHRHHSCYRAYAHVQLEHR